MNVFKFLSIHAGDTQILLIGKPVKRFMVNTAMTLMEDTFDNPAELFDMKPGVVYEFPNDYGYPNQFTIKNNSGSSITPKIYVLEFGDFKKSVQPLPPPPPPTPVLTSITASKTVTTYDVGDVVDYSDVVVTAYYYGKAPENVTALATIGTVSTETAGVKTLSISYTEDGITKTTSISITVSAVVALDYIVADKLVKEYEVGDVVSYDDVTVIAHYTDGTTVDVSAEATIGTISTETAGDKSLSVCYTEDEITDCTSIDIEVVEPTPARELIYSEDYIEANISDETNIGAANWTNIKDRYYTYEFEYEITNNVGTNNSLRSTNAMTSFRTFSNNVSRRSGTKTFVATGSKRIGKPFQCKIGTSGNSYTVKIWNLKIYLEAEDYVPLMLLAPDEP